MFASETGGMQAEFVGALKEALAKPKEKEFVHVDLDAELTKLGFKSLFPLDLWPPSMAVKLPCMNMHNLNCSLLGAGDRHESQGEKKAGGGQPLCRRGPQEVNF